MTNYFRDYHYHVGGAEQAAYRIALLARNQDCSITIAATKSDRPGESEFLVRSIPIIEDYAPTAARKYIEAAKWYSIQYDPLALSSFKKILADENPDVVHFHNFQFLTLSLLKPSKKKGKITVVSIYDYWLFCPTVMLVAPDSSFCSRAHGSWCVDCLPPTMRSFQKILLAIRRPIIDHYLNMVDRFHVLSNHSGTVLEGYGIPSEKICVAPLTLPLEYTDIAQSENSVDPNLILFAGWLNERKGIHRLLEAMPSVLNQHPEAKLRVIGGRVRFGEEYEKKMNRIIDSGGFRDKIEFLGHLHPSEIKRHIQQAAVIVIPEQYENMSPLLMIESMAMSKPIVISKVGGIPEFIEDGVEGWLADPSDARDFAERTLLALKNPQMAAEVGARARQKILSKCDSADIWEKTRKMYERSPQDEENTV